MMLINPEALYEFINLVFWSAIGVVIAGIAFFKIESVVEKWSNGGKYGD